MPENQDFQGRQATYTVHAQLYSNRTHFAGYDVRTTYVRQKLHARSDIGTPESGLPILAISIFGDHTRSAPLPTRPHPIAHQTLLRRRVWYIACD